MEFNSDLWVSLEQVKNRVKSLLESIYGDNYSVEIGPALRSFFIRSRELDERVSVCIVDYGDFLEIAWSQTDIDEPVGHIDSFDSCENVSICVVKHFIQLTE